MKKQNNLTAVIIGLFIFIILSVFYLGLKKSSPQNGAIVILQTSETPIKQGENFSVNVILDAQKEGIDAADIYVKFDPTKLTLVEYKNGNFFKSYLKPKSDNDTIKFSGVSFFDGKTLKRATGRGMVGQITFMAKDANSAEISLDYGKTIIARDGKNIIDSRKSKTLDISVNNK